MKSMNTDSADIYADDIEVSESIVSVGAITIVKFVVVSV